MDEKALQQYLRHLCPVENEACEWKEFKNLKHAVSGRKGEDIISYISALANMQGGFLVVGVKDHTLNIVGIKDFHNYTLENMAHRGLVGNPFDPLALDQRLKLITIKKYTKKLV